MKISIMFHAIALTLGLAISQTADAAFTISIDQAAITNVAPGPTVSVPFTLSHEAGSGSSSLSGYSFQFFGPETATVGFTNDILTGATENLTIGTGAGAFFFNNGANTIAPADFGFVGVDLGDGGQATLFSLDVEVGNLPSYQIGVDFQNAANGFTDISGDFALDGGFDVASPSPAGVHTGGDTTFTITTAAAVPEPSSLVLLGAASCIAFAARRRKRLASWPKI